jgi:D-alanyl-lipoteichoic acid acyltransferase DltB (MBOAT superfamily)
VLFNSYVFIFAFLPVCWPCTPGCAAIRTVAGRSPGWWWLLLLLRVVEARIPAAAAGIGVGECGVRQLLCVVAFRGGRRASPLSPASSSISVCSAIQVRDVLHQNLNELFGAGLTVPKIILPIGISFITFQKIAFLVDAHRGLVRNFSLPNYALFVTFFPQLIAGPIVHHAEMIPQFEKKPAPNAFASDLAVGFSIFCIGLFKKVVVADSLAVYADAGYGMLKAGQPLDFVSAWITVLAYSFQLYYDFSGYSDMAVGLGRMFGIRLPVNFHSPYKRPASSTSGAVGT